MFPSFSNPSTSQLPEDPQRRNEALPQHRHVLGVTADDKRGGRMSPFPQAVQGAQAQNIGPESGIKSEFGRVFSGIGSGVGTATAGPVGGIVPPSSTSSPFRSQDFGPRPVEEPLSKVSRGGAAKRGRRTAGNDNRTDPDGGEDGMSAVSSRAAKKTRHHHPHVVHHGHQ